MALFSTTSSRLGGDGRTSDVYYFAIANAINSGVDVTPFRGVFQVDPGLTANTTFSALIAGYRTSAIVQSAGCMALPKCPWDTTSPSSQGVSILSAFSGDAIGVTGMSATELGARGTQSFTPRMRDLTGQVLSDDGDLIPEMSRTADGGIVIKPGEMMVWKVRPGSATGNPIDRGWFFSLAWKEVATTTYAIGGTVTNGGSPVVGTEITVLVSSDTTMADAQLLGVYTSGAGGAWAADIPAGKIAYAYAQDYSAGTYYTAPGAPYVS